MTSLEITEVTGKQHKHVMEAIRKMEPAWISAAGSNFRLGFYKDATDDFIWEVCNRCELGGWDELYCQICNLK